jgi:hypothetical protein
LEIGESDTFAMKAVEVRCFEDGVSVDRHIAITLVIGNDEHDIGRLRANRDTRPGSKNTEERETDQGQEAHVPKEE